MCLYTAVAGHNLTLLFELVLTVREWKRVVKEINTTNNNKRGHKKCTDVFLADELSFLGTCKLVVTRWFCSHRASDALLWPSSH